MSTCKGYSTARKAVCPEDSDLDKDGYCPQHSASSASCSYTKKKAPPCECRPGFKGAGTATGTSLPHVQTTTTTRTTVIHNPQGDSGKSETIKCAGVKADGQPCLKPIKRDGRLFCSYTHDPAYSEFYVKPSRFSDSTLRSKQEERLWDGRDAYDPSKRLDHDRSHLDHVVEKQIFSAAFGGVLRDGKADRGDQDLLDHLRELAVDREDNLRFTFEETNWAKGAAVKEFLDDHFMSRPLRPGGLTGYMLSQAKLSREVTKEIKREMERTVKQTVRRLEDEGDSSELFAVAGKLQNLAVVMELS
ncbi:hypothetical protein DFJ73DRAFT_936881 [Zopfochytrium polystomum]|nr:hypothetical protein DFJ73DRAFT_936881 [Zopfochytrium polystomum]